jgi:hypothetical protein
MSKKQPKPKPIFVRAYVERANKKRKRPAETKLDRPSKWTLVFDCETTIDPGQALRFGFYQVREEIALREEGIFYDPEGVSSADIQTILAFVEHHRLALHSVRDFVDRIFLKYGYSWRGAIVGFNLPFDLSRLAISHGPARGHMHGGFTFCLTTNTFAPSVRIKYLSRRASLTDFTIGEGQNAPSKGMRKRGMKRDANRGYFIDVKTLAAALTSRGHSLASLCDFLETKTRKQKADEHGAPVTPEYLEYARADVQATWECHVELLRQYQAYGLSVPAHKILSEASIGKACLQQMGVKPLLACQPDFPRELFGRIISAYYGGRAEVRIRREVREVRYCDFKSMYPTVNTLMGLWRFVVADGLTWRDATAEARNLLQRATLDDFQSPEAWRQLPMLVRLRPNGDLLPVRTKYDDKSNTIGVNYLTCDESLWFTLADLIASKILSGKTPEIEEAIRFEPGPIQSGLQPINLLGRPELHINPENHDLFRHLVNLRDKAKGDTKNAIKTINNATSYGVFIEINRDDAAKSEELNVFGPDGVRRLVRDTAVEEPGRFFNPLLGALITGAARLMLSLAERRTLDEGLGWVFCDTDSLAIARPDGMTRDEFIQRVDCVIEWFSALNPYLSRDPILKLEKVNGGPDTPLFAFAISAKRYALFNLDAAGRPILCKASQHGLGHLMPVYKDDDHEQD